MRCLPLWAGCLCLAATHSASAAETAPALPAQATVLTAPLLDGERYLGDAVVQADLGSGNIEFVTENLLALLSRTVKREVMDKLRAELAGQPHLREGQLGSTGIVLKYDAESVALVVDIPFAIRTTQQLSVAGELSTSNAGFETPAKTSAYINGIGALHYSRARGQRDELQGTIYFDGAARFGPVLLESDGIWDISGGDSQFTRRGTRLVYDLPDRALRITAGDILAVGRGFQATSPIAGLSIIKSFGILQPQKIIRPTGRGSFALERASVVDIYVNERLASRIELQPGNYNLSDLPFTLGTNQVRLVIHDESGKVEMLRFNQYFDLNQLSLGLSEFSLEAGFYSSAFGSSPHYTDRWSISGYYRYGLNDALTIEGNFQVDAGGAMAGGGGVWASPLGAFRFDLAASAHQSKGVGFASLLAFQRLLGSSSHASNSVSFSIELASHNFMAVGQNVQPYPFKHRFTVDYLHSFGRGLSAGIGFNKAVGWTSTYNSDRYRANLNWSITPMVRLWADAYYSNSQSFLGSEKAVRFGIQTSLGRRGSASVTHDSQNASTRLSYQTSHGSGVGSYNMFGELEREANDTNVSFDGNYIANRAEIGLSHYSNLNLDQGSSTTLRLGGAIAFADGALSLGPPIHDSFAIISRHRTLQGSNIEVDPTDTTYMAATGSLGTAIRGNLTSYVDRTITVQAPDAPPTAEIGPGAYRLMPPYRSGYRLVVGSDYSISVTGQLVDAQGAPLMLMVGQAKEANKTGNKTVDIFTNAAGRFGASGLRAGRWKLIFSPEQPTSYELIIPDQGDPVVDAGILKPEAKTP